MVDDALRIGYDSAGLGASAWTNEFPRTPALSSTIWNPEWVFINRNGPPTREYVLGELKGVGHGRSSVVHGIREFTTSRRCWIEDGK